MVVCTLVHSSCVVQHLHNCALSFPACCTLCFAAVADLWLAYGVLRAMHLSVYALLTMYAVRSRIVNQLHAARPFD
jgi:hypothetical protein